MSATVKPWSARQQWGIGLWGRRGDLCPTLLAESWLSDADACMIARAHPGGPVRPLMFTRRASARAWCAEKNAVFAASHATSHWRVRVVRVRESWEVLS